MKQDDICQLSGKPDSYVKIKAAEFQKKKTQTIWDASNDEKPDGYVKELSEIMVDNQNKTDEDLETSTEVDTDPEETVQPIINVAKKREPAPSHTGSPRGLAGEADACLFTAPSPVDPQGGSGAKAGAKKPDDEVEQESGLLFMCPDLTEKNPPDKLPTPVIPKILERYPSDKLPMLIIPQVLEMASKAADKILLREAQHVKPAQQALEAEDLAQAQLVQPSLSSSPWKQKTWHTKLWLL